MKALTEIECMLHEIRAWGRPYIDDELPEAPLRPSIIITEWAAQSRAAFTCGYCGGHNLLQCSPGPRRGTWSCAIFEIERSSPASSDRSEGA